MNHLTWPEMQFAPVNLWTLHPAWKLRPEDSPIQLPTVPKDQKPQADAAERMRRLLQYR